MRSALTFASVSALAVLAACRQEPSDIEQRPDVPGNPAPATAARVSVPPATLATGEVPGGAVTVPLQETAREYIERHAGADKDSAADTEHSATGAIAACLMCHGADGGGKRALGAPRIGGLPEWYLARQLKYFKQGVRAATDADVHGTQMRAVVLLIGGEAAMEDLARYLATLRPAPAEPIAGGNVEHGRQLYAVCSACHGPEARGSADLNTPSLAEQDGEYLVRQLENFRAGVRGTHPLDVFGQQMRPIAAATLMSRDDAVDVVAYIGTLRGSGSGNGGAEAGSSGVPNGGGFR